MLASHHNVSHFRLDFFRHSRKLEKDEKERGPPSSRLLYSFLLNSASTHQKLLIIITDFKYLCYHSSVIVVPVAVAGLYRI